MAYSRHPKKLLIINILEILKKYSDESHPLSQREISRILEENYDMKAERKAVRRNLMLLADSDSNIEYSETPRVKRNGETEMLCTDWYYRHEFDHSELRLLIDNLLFTNYIPATQGKMLIEKLRGLSSRYFRPHVRHVSNLSDSTISNKQLFYTIEILDQAIEKQKQICFHYNGYETDKKLHPKLTADGRPRKYVVNPYQIVTTGGRYYLICNHKYHSGVSHYRVDRITDIELRNDPVRPQQEVEGLEHGLNLPEHMAEHIYMFTGQSIRVTFKADRHILNDVIDWFGRNAEITPIDDREIQVRVLVNRQAMFHWLMQYGQYAEVLTPADLRHNVLTACWNMIQKYDQ